MILMWYLLEANIYLTIGYLFYVLLLKRFTFFQQHRYYLLIISLISFVIPLISGNNTTTDVVTLSAEEVVMMTDSATSSPVAPANTDVFWFDTIRLTEVSVILYLVVVCIGVVGLLKGVIQICVLYYRAEKVAELDLRIAILPHQRTVFSFFGWLFSHSSFIKNELILEHEKVHIREKHSLDILWFELLKAFNWFNPVSHLLLKSAKLNHEFIVDSQLAEKYDPYQYAMLLITHAHDHSLKVGHAAFTTTQLEKRMSRMADERSFRCARFFLLLFIPVLLPLMYLSFFSLDKDYALVRFSYAKNQVKAPGALMDGKQDGVEIIAPAPVIPVVGKLNSPDARRTLTGRKKNIKPVPSGVSELYTTASLDISSMRPHVPELQAYKSRNASDESGNGNKKAFSHDRDAPVANVDTSVLSSVYPHVSESKANKSRYVSDEGINGKGKAFLYDRYTSLVNVDTSVDHEKKLKHVISVYPGQSNPNKHEVSIYKSAKRASIFL